MPRLLLDLRLSVKEVEEEFHQIFFLASFVSENVVGIGIRTQKSRLTNINMSSRLETVCIRNPEHLIDRITMFYILCLTLSCEGGPDIEFVGGVFHTKDDAEKSLTIFKDMNKEEMPEFKNTTFHISECAGTYFVETSYDFHGEQQHEVVATFGSKQEAESFVEKEKDETFYVTEYTVDKVVSFVDL